MVVGKFCSHNGSATFNHIKNEAGFGKILERGVRLFFSGDCSFGDRILKNGWELRTYVNNIMTCYKLFNRTNQGVLMSHYPS